MSVLFLSHSSADKAQAERLRDDLRALGFTQVFIDNHSIFPGQAWEQVLYQRLRSCVAVVAFVSANFNGSKWCFAELTHARALGRPIIPVVLDNTPLPEILRDTQFQPVQLDRAGMLERIRMGLEAAGIKADDSLAWDAGRPPYPGLSAFDAADAGVYFGRERDIRTVLDRVHDLSVFGSPPRTLVLLGASGTGKSSLLRAGVLPRLALSPARWVVLPPIRPSQAPLSTLAAALASLDSDHPNTIEVLNKLTSSDRGVDILRRLAGKDSQQTIVIAIDQLEEIATPSDGEAQALRDWLAAVLQIDQPRLIVLGALRSDRVAAVEAVAPLLARGRLVPIAPLTEDDLRRTITGPAEIAGLQLDPDLAPTILRDVRERQALPLLAFALREIWERRTSGSHLTTTSYTTDLERIEGAVRRAADTATQSLLQEQADVEALQFSLLEMVRVSPEGLASKQSTLRYRLPARSEKAINALIAARLLIADGDYIEPAHEALFVAWDRLKQWVEGARAALMVRGEAEADAVRWSKSQGDPEYLWGEARLQRAKRLLATARVGVNAQVAEFFAAATKAIEARHAEERAERDREVKSLRRQRWIVGTLAGGALAAAVVAFLFFGNARQALRTSLLQTAQAACRDFGVGGRDAGIQALKDAAGIRPGQDLNAAYVDCLLRPGLRAMAGKESVPEKASIGAGVLVDRGGNVVATLRRTGVKDVFSVSTEIDGKPVARWEISASDADSLRVSPNGLLVAVVHYPFGMEQQTLDIFEARSGRRLWTLAAETATLSHRTNSSGRISFDESTRYVAVAGIAGSISAWDLSPTQGPMPAMQARPFADQAILVAVSPNGRWVAALDDNNTLAVIEMETNELVALARKDRESKTGDATSLQWTNDDRIVAGSGQWQWLEPVHRSFWARSNIGRDRRIEDVKFNRAGDAVAAASSYGGVPYVADLSEGRMRIRDLGWQSGAFPTGIESVAFRGEPTAVCGTQLAAVFCWDLPTAGINTVARRDFSRSYRDLEARNDQLTAAGGRRFTILESRDMNGKKIWKRRIERTTRFGAEMLFDDSGQRLAHRSDDSSTSFEIVRTDDGSLVTSFRRDDPNSALRPVFANADLLLLNAGDITLRRWPDGVAVRGPFDPTSAELNSTFFARGNAIARRSANGGLTFWDIQSGAKCAVPDAVSPRNPASAFSASGKYFAAFDGEVMKVWSTADCKGQAISSDNIDYARDIAFTPDETKILYRERGKVIIRTLATSHERVVPVESIPNCTSSFTIGSGWHKDGTVAWEACNAGETNLAIRSWNVDDGGIKDDLNIPIDERGQARVEIDPLMKRIVVNYSVSENAIWRWTDSQATDSPIDLCKGLSIQGNRNLKLIDDGNRAMWLDSTRSNDGKPDGPTVLKVLDTKTCKVTDVPRSSATAAVATMESGALVVSTGTSIEAITPDGRVEWTSLSAAGRIKVAAISADRKWVAAALDVGIVVVGRPGESEPVFRLWAGPGDVTSLALGPLGSWLAAGTQAGRVHLWPLADLETELSAGLGVAAQ